MSFLHVFQRRKASCEIPFRSTLRYYLGNQVHVFLKQVTERCVSVISTGFGAHC